MDYRRFASMGFALLLLFTISTIRRAEAREFVVVEPSLGERTDSPYFPYSFRLPGDYMLQDYEGYPLYDPDWLLKANRHRQDGRRPPIAGVAHTYPAFRGSQFYRNAMNRSARSFGSVKPLQTYSNFRYHFENPFRSIR